MMAQEESRPPKSQEFIFWAQVKFFTKFYGNPSSSRGCFNLDQTGGPINNVIHTIIVWLKNLNEWVMWFKKTGKHWSRG